MSSTFESVPEICLGLIGHEDVEAARQLNFGSFVAFGVAIEGQIYEIKPIENTPLKTVNDPQVVDLGDLISCMPHCNDLLMERTKSPRIVRLLIDTNPHPAKGMARELPWHVDALSNGAAGCVLDFNIIGRDKGPCATIIEGDCSRLAKGLTLVEVDFGLLNNPPINTHSLVPGYYYELSADTVHMPQVNHADEPQPSIFFSAMSAYAVNARTAQSFFVKPDNNAATIAFEKALQAN